MKALLLSVTLLCPYICRADVVDAFNKLQKSWQESSDVNDKFGDCENLAKEYGPHEILKKVGENKYLAAVLTCSGRNNCSLGDALVVETETQSFDGKTALTTDLWVKRSGKSINVKDEDGFDHDYKIYKEDRDCAIAGSIHNYGKYAIAFAAKNGNLQLLKDLEKKGQDINIQDSTGVSVLDIAQTKNNTEIINYLKSKNARLGASKLVDQFVKSMTEKDFKTAKILMKDLEPNLRYEGSPILQIAAVYGDTEIVKYLVEKNAKIDAVDEYNITPLIIACSAGNTEIVQFLISKGSNINHVTDKKKTALSEAKAHKHLDIVKILVAAGAKK